MGIFDGIKKRFSIFDQKTDQTNMYQYGPASYGPVVMYNNSSSRSRRFINSEKSIIAAIYNRIAVDCANVDIYHIKKDTATGRFQNEVKDGINNCISVSANIDQAGRAFRQDIYQTLLDEGVIAVVATETSDDPDETGSYDVYQMRVGIVEQWYPQHVAVNVYNERTGLRQTIIQPKSNVAIIENPFYSIMNEPNSTYQRLVRKLNMLDAIDEQTSSGKLDIIIQLPYVIKNERKEKEAQERSQSIQTQLKDSKYGIAYIDGTEKITQLNRPAENNLLKQVESLTVMLYDQLGITKEVLNGTATEEVMMHYQERTVKSILTAVVEGLSRTFLTKTARTQGHDIHYFQDPFSLVPISKLAELADKLTRNEIVTSNEVRGALALKPSMDPRADMLLNKNLPTPEDMNSGVSEDEDHTLDSPPTSSLSEVWDFDPNMGVVAEEILEKERDRQNGI